ncbi:hypothetical protein J437_LFUL018942 [Ladona fulva]|uniref:Tudor domain-containing protein n=1 Tax=Ladona fulva TaxID=123851 RepID=A0A8K0KQG0_LADFU|nr:hypothetical protein J437_LFUL018942 [Ladona fulva]
MEDFPAGIIKHKFLTAYKEKYQEELPMADCGFDNLMAILAHLASRNVIHLRFSGNLPMICSPFNNPEEYALKELRQDNDFISSLYPRGVLLPSDDIPVQPLPENFTVGCSIDVLVTEVITPSFFWYQLWGSDVQAEFNEMMDELQTVYNSGGPGDHRMPDATIQIGQYCAVKYPPDPDGGGEWHRSRITSIPSLSEVEVFYVDYGSKCKVLRSEIRFLDKKYGKLPLQAHKASLVSVRPHGFGLWLQSDSSASIKTKPTWTPEACNFFLKMVENLPLVGVVAGLEQDEVKFALIDTSKENDLHINDLLVFAKLAEFGEMSEVNEQAVRSCSRTSNESSGKSSNNAVAETKLPGPRPPSVERNVETNVNKPMNLQFDECSLNRTSTSPMSIQNSAERERGGLDSDRFPSESDVMLPTSAGTSPMSLPSSHGKGRFVPDLPELHLGRMTSSPRSAASSPMSPFPLAERSMFGSDTDVFHIGSATDTAKNADSPRQLSTTERNTFGLGTSEMSSEHAVELPGGSTTSPVLQQNVFQCANVQAFHQGNTPNNLEGLNHFDDKALKVQLELERLQLCQQQLQYQQFQTQLLLMAAAQNSLMLGLPTVPNPLQAGKVIPPPPGLPPLNPLRNTQSNIMDLSSSMLLNSNLLAGFQPLNIPQSYGTFPYGNISNPQFPASSALNLTNLTNSVGSSISQLNPPYPTGFDNKASSAKTCPSTTILPAPSLHEVSLSDKIPDQLAPLEKPKDCEVTMFNSSKNADYDLKKDKNGISVTDASCNSLHRNFDLNKSGDNLTVGGSKDNIFLENRTNSEQKSEHQTLHTSFEACSISSDSVSSSSQQKYKKRDEEKWRVLFEVDDKADEKIVLQGIVNGKPVQVLRIGGTHYVLTEEILGLFHSGLPVHVAMKIAKLKPNGKKIESISINARKNKDVYKRIQSLVGIGLVADGSDLHLTSVESLHYLCSSLELSD